MTRTSTPCRKTQPCPRASARAAGVAAALAVASSCQVPIYIGEMPPPQAAEVPLGNRPLDVLLVIDNSGSMCEEQESLARSFFDADCPIHDLRDVPEALLNPSPGVLETLTEHCGFSQILAAYDRDFRVGVITTDVSACDNDYGQSDVPLCAFTAAPAEQWGRRPQRGCLVAPPGSTKKFIDRDDGEVAASFIATIQNVGIYGSGVERGLDAVEQFLSPDAERAPGCEGDLDGFLRDEAQLLIVFMTDEEDCSHADSAFGFPDENAGETCGGDGVPPFFDPAACSTMADRLAPVERYAEMLRAYKGEGREADVMVAVIAGAVPGEDGLEPAGCMVSPEGVAVAGCAESGGNSNGPECAPAEREAAGLPPCCTADGGGRYFDLARRLGGAASLETSICAVDHRVPIIRFLQRTEDDG